MIVKVQLSKASSDGKTRCIIYDKKRDFFWEGMPTEEISQKMGARDKAFYHLASEGRGLWNIEAPTLGYEATWQEW